LGIVAIWRLGVGCLVLTARDALLEGDALQALRAELNCPVVLLREPGSSEVNPHSFVASN
jgi:hypothetical protein